MVSRKLGLNWIRLAGQDHFSSIMTVVESVFSISNMHITDASSHRASAQKWAPLRSSSLVRSK